MERKSASRRDEMRDQVDGMRLLHMVGKTEEATEGDSVMDRERKYRLESMAEVTKGVLIQAAGEAVPE